MFCQSYNITLQFCQTIQLIRVLGHMGIDGNETVAQQARMRTKHPFIEPEQICIISKGVDERVTRVWMNKDHRIFWELILKHIKGFFQESSMELPFNVPQFKVVLHLIFNFNNPKSVMSIKFPPFKCSDAMVPKEDFNGGFTVLGLNMNKVRTVTRLFTGHCHLKEHLFKLELVWNLRKVS